MKKERLDLLLLERGFTSSRQKAKAIIMSGIVYVNGQKEDKAGSTFDVTSEIEIKGLKPPFVSRGGFKLDKAIKEFNISLENLNCMDIGASTGGFTDCMLQNGANKVYSIDVGYGQLAWELRNNEKVICMEKFNVRYIKKEDIGDEIDFASVDVSFISLEKILLPIKEVLKDGASIVCLIKPQFEAGREEVGKNGVVRDKKVHIRVIENVMEYAGKIGFLLQNLSFSPIKGPEGNIEYLLYMKKSDEKEEKEFDVYNLVDYAHKTLKTTNGE